MRMFATLLLLIASTAWGIEPRLTARTEARRPSSYIFIMKVGTQFHVFAYEKLKDVYRVRLINGIGTKLNIDDVKSIIPQYEKTWARGSAELDPAAAGQASSTPTTNPTTSNKRASINEDFSSRTSVKTPDDVDVSFDSQSLTTIRHRDSPHRSGRRTTARANPPARSYMPTPYYDSDGLFSSFNGGGYSGGGYHGGGGGPVHVRGHWRDGHWVNPYTRSRPSR